MREDDFNLDLNWIYSTEEGKYIAYQTFWKSCFYWKSKEFPMMMDVAGKSWEHNSLLKIKLKSFLNIKEVDLCQLPTNQLFKPNSSTWQTFTNIQKKFLFCLQLISALALNWGLQKLELSSNTGPCCSWNMFESFQQSFAETCWRR